MTTDTAPAAAALWARAFQTWTDAWLALVGQARTADTAPADPFQLWRRSFDQWLEGWSVYFDETLNTPRAAAAGGRALDAMLNVEKPLRERTAATMQYWLEFANMPTRGDVIRVLSQLNDANARLDELQEQVETLTDQVAALGAARAVEVSAPQT